MAIFGKKRGSDQDRDTAHTLYGDDGQKLEVKEAQVLDAEGHVLSGPDGGENESQYGQGTGAGYHNEFHDPFGFFRQAGTGPRGAPPRKRRSPLRTWFLALTLMVLVPLLLVGGFVFAAVFIGFFVLLNAIGSIGRKDRRTSGVYVIRRR